MSHYLGVHALQFGNPWLTPIDFFSSSSIIWNWRKQEINSRDPQWTGLMSGRNVEFIPCCFKGQNNALLPSRTRVRLLLHLLCNICIVIYQQPKPTFMPSHLETALSGRRARKVRRARKAPMFPYPALSANRLSKEICQEVTKLNTHTQFAHLSENLMDLQNWQWQYTSCTRAGVGLAATPLK